MSWKKFAALAAVSSLALAGCASTGGDAGAAGDNADIKICVYTHGDGGTFWSVAQAGAEAAAADLLSTGAKAGFLLNNALISIS